MTTLVFVGEVRPKRDAVTAGPVFVRATDAAGKELWKAEAAAVAGLLNVRVETDEALPDVLTIRNNLTHHLDGWLGLVGLPLGRSFSSALLAEVNRTPAWVFDTRVEELALPPDAVKLLNERILKLVAAPGNPKAGTLQIACRDLCRAIDRPHDTGFYCFRALEAIRNSFANTGGPNPKADWPAMNAALRIKPFPASWLTTASELQRHGHGAPMDHTERVAALKFVQEVCIRFSEYAETGLALSPPTPLIEAPALTVGS